MRGTIQSQLTMKEVEYGCLMLGTSALASGFGETRYSIYHDTKQEHGGIYSCLGNLSTTMILHHL